MLSFNLLSKIPPILFNIVKKSGADVKESPGRLLSYLKIFFPSSCGRISHTQISLAL